MKTRKRIVDIIILVLLLAGSVLMLYPFVWMIFTSFKPKLHCMFISAACCRRYGQRKAIPRSGAKSICSADS